MKKKQRIAGPSAPTLGLLIGSLVFVLSCSSGYVKYLAPDEVNRLAENTRVVAELKDGRTIALMQPQFQNGNLLGTTDVKQVGTHALVRRMIPASDIRWVKTVKRDQLVYAFIPAALAAAWLVLGAATAPDPPPAESCPFVYSWDGRQFVFEAEPYGGAVCRGLQRSEWCRLDWLRASGGSYLLRIANELDETQYTDEVKLIVVDHEPGLRIAADTGGGLHAFGVTRFPLSARDEDGRDIRPLVESDDLLFWESGSDVEALQRKADLRHELHFIFPKPRGASQVKLLADAWTSTWGAEVPRLFLLTLGRDLAGFYKEVNAFGPAWQKLMAWFLTEELYLLRIQVKTENGWRTRGYIQGGGPFIAKGKAYPIDIGDVPGDTLELKLCPPVTFWRINQLLADYSPDPALNVKELAPRRAVDREGQDVTRLLEAVDQGYVVSPRAGEWTDLYFEEPPPEGHGERSFILKINGYYDIHLPTSAEPRRDIAGQFLDERGFTIRYSLAAFSERQKQKR